MRSDRFPSLRLFAACVLALGVFARVANAQDTFDAPPHVAFVDGIAALEREGISQPPTTGVPFLPGDRLRSSEGRLEVLFADGTTLHLDEYSEIDLLAPTLIRLTRGRLRLTVTGADDPDGALVYQVDTPGGSATTDGPGEYRVSLRSSVDGPEVELAVLTGWGILSTEAGSTDVRAGERSIARDGVRPARPQQFNAARLDAFDRWSAVRRDARLAYAESSRYLPDNLRSYGSTFDRYGVWTREPEYGYVWYPAVAPDWRPYHHGYWSALPSYGWTWVGMDVWGWPTHHYGRWGYARSRWFWIPDRHWGPAWVSWAASPGYVSWCPLGFNNRPVFSLSINIGTPWYGWVAVPRTRFVSVTEVHVYRHVVASNRLPEPRTFVAHDRAPIEPPRRIVRNDGVQTVRGGNPPAVRAGGTGSAVRAGGAQTVRSGSDMTRAGANDTVRAGGDRGVVTSRAPAGRIDTPSGTSGASRTTVGGSTTRQAVPRNAPRATIESQTGAVSAPRGAIAARAGAASRPDSQSPSVSRTPSGVIRRVPSDTNRSSLPSGSPGPNRTAPADGGSPRSSDPVIPRATPAPRADSRSSATRMPSGIARAPAQSAPRAQTGAQSAPRAQSAAPQSAAPQSAAPPAPRQQTAPVQRQSAPQPASSGRPQVQPRASSGSSPSPRSSPEVRSAPAPRQNAAPAPRQSAPPAQRQAAPVQRQSAPSAAAPRSSSPPSRSSSAEGDSGRRVIRR